MKIIVGFDGTDPAVDALCLGSDLARDLQAKLIVAAVFESPPGELRGSSSAEARERYFSETFARAEAEIPGTPFERRMLDEGSAARGTLMDLAEDVGANLLVIGSTHLGAAGRAVAGTAGKLLFNNAPCGVAVAPEDWARRHGGALRRIGVGYDGTEESKVALRHAAQLARELEADLRLIAVAPYVDPRLSAVIEQPEEWVEKLKAGGSLVGGKEKPELVLRQGRPATELAQQGVEADLLVVGSRKRGQIRRAILGSVSSELVRTSPCPVLVVPRGAEAPDAKAPRASSGRA